MSNRKRMVTPTMLRKASPPPQIPAVDRTEGPSHPAAYPDPDFDQYEKGDTSAWAEDVHPPPYPEGAPPAIPSVGMTEDASHPAHNKAAAMDKEAAYKRAAICVRIAQTLNPGGTVDEIETEAGRLMDLPTERLNAVYDTLRLAKKAEDDEDEGQDEASDDDDDAKMSGKKASDMEVRVARIESAVGKLVTAMGSFFAEDHEAGYMTADDLEMLEMDDMDMLDDGDEMDDVDLEVMMAEMDQNDPEYGYMAEDHDHMSMDHDHMAEDDDIEAMLMAMEDDHMAQDEFDRGEESEGTELSDEGMMAALMAMEDDHMAQDDFDRGEESEGTRMFDEGRMASEEEDITVGEDPMGLIASDEDAEVGDSDLMSLYADLDLSRTAAETEEEEAKEDDDADDDEKAEKDDEDHDSDDEKEKMGGKKASVRKPQNRKASVGPKSLGAVSLDSKTARSEVTELENLWATEPDVSEYFK